MTIININIIESAEQVISGIPKTITISTNIPVSVFYTLDGTTPTLLSNIYTGPIFLPINLLTVTLNVFATNGVVTSPIITEVYTTDVLENARLPHSATDVEAGTIIPSLYPFGNNPIHPLGNYLNPGDAGINVDNPDLPQISNGFDSNGNPNNFTNAPFNSENYDILYTTTDAEGQTGPNIGNLPANVKIEMPIAPPEETEQFSNIFNPRAYIIFQDFSKENPNDPPQVNKQFFSLEDPEKARDGNYYYNSGLDAPPVNGSFLRAHYNPRDNTFNYYYLDTWANRWIISKTPYIPTGTYDGNLSQISSGRNGKGVGQVFEWLPFARRVLF